MELDWCSDDTLSNTANFNENIVIDKDKKNVNGVNKQEGSKNNFEIEKCFEFDLNISNSKNLLSVLNYLSLVSNYLKTFIRNKSTKHNEYYELTTNEYLLIIKYLEWLNDSCNSVKKYFATSLRRDNSYDPNTIKLFKTSSYKFCNFKESCQIHKNKNKCDKNHFVFEMIINDISKLIESIKIIGIDCVNWVLSNNIIKITFCPDNKTYSVEKLLNSNLTGEINENQFVIDKTLMFKSFDVISYVLNKMYDEAFYFINFDIDSHLINCKF